MANSAAGEARDFSTQIIEEFRANQGRVVRAFLEGAPVILLHHTGARSGIERVTPVGCSAQGEGRFAVWAANGGSPPHPAWYHNLKAHPRSRSRWAPSWARRRVQMVTPEQRRALGGQSDGT